jgi:hypothetical protein
MKNNKQYMHKEILASGLSGDTNLRHIHLAGQALQKYYYQILNKGTGESYEDPVRRNLTGKNLKGI